MKTAINKRIIMAIVIVAIGVGGFYFITNKSEAKEVSKQTFTMQNIKMTVYKSPNCGCCNGYVKELEKQGFDVNVIALNNINTIKMKYGIPADKQSCHTTIVGNYFIEGHVPIQAIKKLLKEKPAIDGIGLPGMPIGTPGMPGVKTAPYKVYQSVNGKISEYITI